MFITNLHMMLMKQSEHCHSLLYSLKYLLWIQNPKSWVGPQEKGHRQKAAPRTSSRLSPSPDRRERRRARQAPLCGRKRGPARMPWAAGQAQLQPQGGHVERMRTRPLRLEEHRRGRSPEVVFGFCKVYSSQLFPLLCKYAGVDCTGANSNMGVCTDRIKECTCISI